MKHKTVTAENGKEYSVDMEGDGPRALVFSARTKAATFLRELGYTVTVTVTGPGGAPIDADSAAIITAAMTAPKGVSPRDAGLSEHGRRMKARMESGGARGTGKTPSRPRKAAKRPA